MKISKSFLINLNERRLLGEMGQNPQFELGKIRGE